MSSGMMLARSSVNGNNAILSNLLDDSAGLHSPNPSRPTSAPPDLEFSSTNVFAFGLKNFNSSFRANSNNNSDSGHGSNGLDAVSQMVNPIRQPLVDDANLHHQWNSSPMSSSPSSSSPASVIGRPRLSQSGAPLLHRSLSDDSSMASSNDYHHHHHHQSSYRDYDNSSSSFHDQLSSNTASLDSLSLNAHNHANPNNAYDSNYGFPQLSMAVNSSAGVNGSLDLNGFPTSMYNNNNAGSSIPFNNAQLTALLQHQMARLTAQAHTSPMSLDDKLLLLQFQQNQAMQAALLQQQFRAINHQQQFANHSQRKFHQHYQRDGVFNNGGNGGGRGGRDYRVGGNNNHRMNRGGNMNGNFHHGGMNGHNANKNMRGFNNQMFDSYDKSNEFDNQSLMGSDDFSGGLSAGLSSTNDYQSQFTSQSTIEELTGNIYNLAKDQYGCRLLQRMIDDDKPQLIELIFNELFEHVNELMTDPFSNYLLQKFIEHCNELQRLALLNKCSNDLVGIALNMHGTRVVQKLVEMANTAKEIELLIAALKTNVVTMCKDLNGNHVIQRCLHHLASKDNQFIYDNVSRHCVSVATHKHGCCVLQRCIDYATLAQKKQLIQEIINNALELVQDAFGNYVCQYVLDLGDHNHISGISQQLLGHVSSLAVQKFSSNVVEKCLELSNEKVKFKIIEELIQPERLPRLLNDPYSNYVIQKALTVAKRQQFERMVTLIKPHLAALNNTAFGKRISAKIMRKFPHINHQPISEENDSNTSSPSPPGSATLSQRHVGMPLSEESLLFSDNQFNAVRPSLSGYAAAAAGSGGPVGLSVNSGLSNADPVAHSMSPSGQISYASALWKSQLQRAASEGNAVGSRFLASSPTQ